MSKIVVNYDSVNPPSMAYSSSTMNKDTIWCMYCKRLRHTRDQCRKLYGKPQTFNKDWGFKSGQQGFKGGQQIIQTHFINSQINENPLQERVNFDGNEHIELNKEKFEKLKNLLGTLESPSGAYSLTQSNKYSPSLTSSVSDMSFLGSQVINQGTTDHMTHSSQQFSTYSSCPSNKKIIIVDCSLATVAGQGEVHLNKSIVLKNVLYVPKLSTNLVSIH